MPGMRLLLLGSPQLEREGKHIPVSRRKAMALLAYLAVTGEAHRRETLATLLWSDYDQSRAYANLRRDLSVLNKTLGKGWLDIDPESVTLLESDDFWLDATHFRRLVQSCRKHGHPEGEVCTDCLSLLDEAVTVYRGDFMAGFTLPDSPSFDEWQFFESEELRCELAGVLIRLVHGYSARAEYEIALPFARRWLAIDPLHELAHRELMRLYAWAGQQAAAIRQYQACVQVLEEELGQGPEEATTELYRAIRAKRVPDMDGLPGERREGRRAPRSLSAEVQRVNDRLADRLPYFGSRDHPSVRHNLRPQPTPFIGRETELADIGRLLLDEPGCRMLTLVGPGGVGKTRLAWQAAHEAISAFPNGVYMVSLTPVRSAELLAPTIADALFLFFQGRTDPEAQLLNYLREKEILLVLDNFEHLLEGASRLAEILEGAPGVKLLVTSRERLNLQWEWIREIGGLTYPTPKELDQLAGEATAAGIGDEILEEYSAVKLFVESARRIHPNFFLTGEVEAAVVRICHLLDGIPLGLELAAAWMRAMPCQEIAREIERDLDFLSSSLRDVPERHRSLRALFEHSWEFLSDLEKGVVRRLSVFPGRFGREAAEQVADASLNQLAALVDKSLLRHHASGRYSMHELVKQYAADKLRSLPEESNAARNRHCDYYAAFLHGREKDLRGARQGEVQNEIAGDIDNVRVAWRWAISQAKLPEIRQCIESLHLFYHARGWVQEGEEVFREAAAALGARRELIAEGDGGDALDLVRGQVLARQGRFAYRLGLYPQARRLLQDSLGLFGQLESQDYPGARLEKAFSLYYLSEIIRKDGDFQAAKGLCEESLAIYRQSGDSLGLGRALRRLGTIAGSLGDYREARILFREALEKFQEIDDRYGIANTLNDLGLVADGQGQYGEAKRLFHECLAIRREIGHLGGIGASLNNLGYFAYMRGEHEEAKRLLEESLLIQKEIGDQYHMALCLSNLGAVVCALGEHQDSQAYFYEALRFALEVRSVPLALDGLVGIASLFATSEAGEKKRAAELFAFVLHHPTSDNWMKDRATRGLDELAFELPPEQLEAVHEMGKTGILEVIAAEILGEMIFHREA